MKRPLRSRPTRSATERCSEARGESARRSRRYRSAPRRSATPPRNGLQPGAVDRVRGISRQSPSALLELDGIRIHAGNEHAELRGTRRGQCTLSQSTRPHANLRRPRAPGPNGRRIHEVDRLAWVKKLRVSFAGFLDCDFESAYLDIAPRALREKISKRPADSQRVEIRRPPFFESELRRIGIAGARAARRFADIHDDAGFGHRIYHTQIVK